MSHYTGAHKHLQCLGGARPTALQVFQDNNLIGNVEGKVVLVTEISSETGIETARALKATGMRVFGTVRNITEATEALKDDLEPEHLELVELDMNSFGSVEACAKELLFKTDKLNIFVANAGIVETPEGKFGTNHLAHFLLFQLLKPKLLNSSTQEFASRVIYLSFVGHGGGEIDFDRINFEGTYDNPNVAYNQSKYASVYMAEEIERRYLTQNLHAWVVMPKGIWTGLDETLPNIVKLTWKDDNGFQGGWKSTEKGVATTLWAALEKDLEAAPEPKSIVDGAYIPWQALDGEKLGRLWQISCEMVGVKNEVLQFGGGSGAAAIA